MSLLDDIQQDLAKNYIKVSTVIDILAKHEGTYKNMYQLLSYFELNKVLTCYKLDKKLRLIDKDENNQPFDILENREIILGLEFLRNREIDNKYFVTDEEIENIDEAQFRQCENSGNGLSKFYWTKKEFISIDSLKPLTEILFDENEIINLGKDHESLTKMPNIEYQNLKIENERLKSELADALEKIKELEGIITNHKTHPAIDKTHSYHAPELILAIEAWEAKYLKNEYPHDGHTPSIAKILKNKGYENKRLIDRISAITNPNK